LGQLDVLHTHNLEIQLLEGTTLGKVSGFVKEPFVWPENGFIVFRRYDLVKKSVVGVGRYILG
jgi:hypothetical protein